MTGLESSVPSQKSWDKWIVRLGGRSFSSDIEASGLKRLGNYPL